MAQKIIKFARNVNATDKTNDKAFKKKKQKVRKNQEMLSDEDSIEDSVEFYDCNYLDFDNNRQNNTKADDTSQPEYNNNQQDASESKNCFTLHLLLINYVSTETM